MTTSRATRSARALVAPVLGALACAAPAALGAPVISGTDADAWNATNPVPDYTITASSRRARIFWFMPGVAAGEGRSPLRVRLPRALPDGTYRLLAVEDFESDEQQVTSRAFRVDTVPPVVTIRRPLPGEVFDRGSSVAADYSCEGAVSCAGPVGTGAPLDLRSPGSLAFRVTAVDDAGNQAVGEVGYMVRERVATISRFDRPRIVNARAMRPRSGVTVTSRRPTLRWRGRAGARLYNVQLYRLRGGTATKVLSAFPARSRLRIPPRKLAFGGRYVWRVWPYLATGYPRRPLGVSFFDVGRPRRT